MQQYNRPLNMLHTSLILHPILENGTVPGKNRLPETAENVCSQTARLYASVGYTEPWIGYLAEIGGCIVGGCAFTSAPKSGRVEIAYYTFPDYENRGIGTMMANELVAMAKREYPSVIIFAQTLPQKNASTCILEKNGFKKIKDVIHPEEGLVWEWELLPNRN